MKYFLGVLMLVSLWSCKEKEVPLKDAFQVEGIIKNVGFDKFFVSDVSSLQPHVNIAMNPNVKGYVGDTMFVTHKGFYLANYGNKNFLFYAEPGDNIRFQTDNTHFEKELKFENDQSFDNNYMLQTNKAVQDTLSSMVKDAYQLEEKSFLQRIDSLEAIIENILKKEDTNVKPLVKEFIRANYQLEIYNALNRYPQTHAYLSQKPNYKVGKAFENRMQKLPELSDSMVIFLPTYRQILLTQFEQPLNDLVKKNEKAIDAHETAFVYQLLDVLQPNDSLSQLKKDYLIGTFALQFDYLPENPLLKKVNDSLQKVIKNEEVKKELQFSFEILEGLQKGENAPMVSGKNKKAKTETIAFDRPTLLYFYTTVNPSIDSDIEDLNALIEEKKDSLQVVSINMDKERDWKYFVDNYTLQSNDIYEEQRMHSQVAKDYDIELAILPKLVLVDKNGKIYKNNLAMIGSNDFEKELNSFLKQ